MSRIIIVFTVLLCSVTASAQNQNEEKSIKEVLKTFFIGLHKGDSTLLKSTLHKNLKIQTTFTTSEGEKQLRTQTKSNLLKQVASKKTADMYLEKIHSYTIHVDGNLASVWTPYSFFLNGNFSHCGANSFQLFNDNGIWKIIYLVDMRRRANCEDAKQKK
ncbi:nuclear transport factor 2 family protein [Polaribacter sp. WD7]|uniref:nuclear transport factor 2 family protein n=1 Tax=Polaribacter sp. WD7 TaxID=2269061 RepID=UPI000DF485A8|nr:nuclear transport factor 2 family protein [Polaribacter sp. WD7]RCS26095.1 nuclear transport factor 2 family protein [Polaribacter sp. WD7]